MGNVQFKYLIELWFLFVIFFSILCCLTRVLANLIFLGDGFAFEFFILLCRYFILQVYKRLYLDIPIHFIFYVKINFNEIKKIQFQGVK